MGVVEDFIKAKQSEKLQMLKVWDIQYYNNDAPTITDTEYDECLAYYNNKYKKKYVSSLGKAGSLFPKFEHTYPVLSLEKIVTREGFIKEASEFDFNCVLEPKLDGLTVVYYPDGKIVSRGDGHVGEVLNAERVIPGLPAPYSLPIRLEAVITKSVFEKHFRGTNKNARNLAAGVLRRKEDSDDLKHITFYAYNILGADDMSEEQQMNTLRQLGFTVPEVLLINNQADLEKAYDNMEEWSKDQDYWTDGVVVKANIAKTVKDFGMTAHHPNNAFAFKFVSMTKTTKLIGIDWSLGYDRLTPVAEFEPVILGGNTIARASMHNLNIMEKLGVKMGSQVTVTLKNEIIPQIIESNGQGEEIVIPTICPTCGSTLIINKTKEVVCVNPECEAKFLDTMTRIASKNGLDITGLSSETIDLLYQEAKLNLINVANPFACLEWNEDLYVKAFDRRFNKRKKVQLNLFDEVEEEAPASKEETKKVRYIATKIYTEVQNKRNNVVPAKFLYCCNIPELGINTAKLIMQHFKDLEDFLANWNTPVTDADGNELPKGRSIEGIGEVTFDYINNNLDLIREYMQHVTSFAPNNFYVDTTAPADDQPKLKICISGSLSNPKSYYENLIVSSGNIYATSVTKDLTHLVSNETGTSKVVKAQKYGIPVISEEDLLKLLGK